MMLPSIDDEAIAEAKKFPSQHRVTISGPETLKERQWSWKRRDARFENILCRY